jgi:hypothetical protein
MSQPPRIFTIRQPTRREHVTARPQVQTLSVAQPLYHTQRRSVLSHMIPALQERKFNHLIPADSRPLDVTSLDGSYTTGGIFMPVETHRILQPLALEDAKDVSTPGCEQYLSESFPTTDIPHAHELEDGPVDEWMDDSTDPVQPPLSPGVVEDRAYLEIHQRKSSFRDIHTKLIQLQKLPSDDYARIMSQVDLIGTQKKQYGNV